MDGAQQSKMSCGVYMACSYLEGYLAHVVPDLHQNMRVFEARHGVCFPAKQLFVVVPRSLYCPPDLADFTRGRLPALEAVLSLEDVRLDVAGVRGRSYRNAAYKIARSGALPPVHVVAELATPLHTLYKVRAKRAVYRELCDVDAQQIVEDFCAQVSAVVARSPDCRGRCALVRYDDTDPNQNLATVLVDKIRELQPDFEEVVATHMELNRQ